MAETGKNSDVRMKGFSQRSTVDAAIAWIDQVAQSLRAEEIPLVQAAGRVLSAPIVSDYDVPRFRRAMMDGYAVFAEETQGASSYNRLLMNVVGEILPGQPTTATGARSQAMRIMTGAPMPAGFDAVLPVEWTETVGSQTFAIGEVASQKHVGQIGEDIARGATVLLPGRRLRPQDLGVLASIGISSVSVIRQPVVRLLITGNELLPAGSVPTGNCIVDSNSPMLSALVARDGGAVIHPGIVPDQQAIIAEAMQSDCDVLLVSGGSSVGREDHAPIVLAELGELALHGIAMRPSSPTGMGRIGDRLVFLLPGNPVSCLCAYDFFAGRAIRSLGGRSKAWPYRSEKRQLNGKLVSQIGRVDYARVRIINEGVEPLAISGASVLSSTTQADGFVIIPSDSEGAAAGSTVEVFRYD
jgi:molybdopterin molybdotransferase